MKNNWIPSAPVTINWAVTNRCNFGCRHCYSRADTSEELAFNVISELLGKISGAKVFSINFGGGEPLLRRDIFDIARSASELGLVVSMNSNGFLIDKTVAQKLKEAGFKKVGISIDSPRPETHDEFRGMKGSHEKAVSALKYLKEAGIETSISSVICKINIDDIDGLIEQALSSGVENLNFHNFKCSGLGFTNKDELDLSPGEWKDFYILMRSLVKPHTSPSPSSPPLKGGEILQPSPLEGEPACPVGRGEGALLMNSLVKVSTMKDRSKNLHISLEDPIIASLGLKNGDSLVKGSVCGKLSLNIKSNGDITPCGFIPVVIGNLCNDDLIEIWENSPVLDMMRNKTPKGKCIKCGHYSDCLGGCTARALALTGDINNPDPHCWEPS